MQLIVIWSVMKRNIWLFPVVWDEQLSIPYFELELDQTFSRYKMWYNAGLDKPQTTYKSYLREAITSVQVSKSTYRGFAVTPLFSEWIN